MIPGRLPYELCLIPDIPQDVQHTLRNVSNFVVIPVDMLLASLSLICNLLVLILTAVIRTRSIHHPSLLLLCSLSITDILWVIFTIVKNIETVTHEHLYPGKMQSQQKNTREREIHAWAPTNDICFNKCKGRVILSGYSKKSW